MTVAQLAQERRDRRRVATLGAALAAVSVVTLLWGIPHIEAELTHAAEQVLAERDWSFLSVEFSGRDATVAGTADVDPTDVAGAIAAIEGVRSVRFRAEPLGHATEPGRAAPSLGNPLVTLSVSPAPGEPNGQTVAIGGTVPSELVFHLATEAGTKIARDGTVVNNLEVAPTRDALWLTRLDVILQALDGAGHVTVVLGNDRAVVEGTVMSDGRIDEIRTAVVAAATPELEVIMQLDVVPALSPVIEIVTDGDSIRIWGQIPEDAVTIVQSVADQVFGPRVTLDVSVEGVADAAWLDTLWELIPHLDQAVDLRIDVDGSGVIATGSVASPALVDVIESALTTVGELAGAQPTLDVIFDVVAAAELCPPEQLNALGTGGVLFESNSTDLTEEGLQIMGEVAELVRDCDGVVLEVGGHTDDLGDAAYNQFLSEQRATAVVDYLVDQVDPERLVPVGYGETQPVADNGTSEGRALNRRIEFTLLGG